MINKEVYTKAYITEINKKYRADPQIIERTVFAFGLLQALVKSGADFIFKGGTSLMLLLDKPLRLSTDIDIIVEPGYDISSYVEKAGKIYPFIRCEENVRRGFNDIVKRHFRFYYKSLIDETKETPILLDVLFENNHYSSLIEKEIKTEFLETSGSPVYIKLPSADSILGDKLTAFAPHTIGVKPMNRLDDGKIIDKRIETIKQFFDAASLYDAADNINETLETYKQTAAAELKYRGLTFTYRDCLKDTFNAALSIMSRGKWHTEDYADYLAGIRGLGGYLIDIRFNAENAFKQASKVMYLTACMISETSPDTNIPEAKPFADEYSFINYVRKLDRQSFNMAAKAIELMKNQ